MKNLHKTYNCHDLEIVGLKMNGNGWSCTCHHTCGSLVKVGDILSLKMMIITVKGRGVENAMVLIMGSVVRRIFRRIYSIGKI